MNVYQRGKAEGMISGWKCLLVESTKTGRGNNSSMYLRSLQEKHFSSVFMVRARFCESAWPWFTWESMATLWLIMKVRIIKAWRKSIFFFKFSLWKLNIFFSEIVRPTVLRLPQQQLKVPRSTIYSEEQKRGKSQQQIYTITKMNQIKKTIILFYSKQSILRKSNF